MGQSTRFPWVLASNRDEFHDRPALPLGWWQGNDERPDVLAGRDLAAGGSWLALRADGRLALLTNVREPGRFDSTAPSRGALVVEGLQAGPANAAWLQGVVAAPRNGFNLLLADLSADLAVWATNRSPQQRVLGKGIYGLSNASLDTPWPKVTHLKRTLGTLAASAGSAESIAVLAFAALADRAPVADHMLPRTGVPIERERQLSPSFIHIPATAQTSAYGTRCSTVVVVENLAAERRVHVFERSFDADGREAGEAAGRVDRAVARLPFCHQSFSLHRPPGARA